jgi:hypothetical protein
VHPDQIALLSDDSSNNFPRTSPQIRTGIMTGQATLDLDCLIITNTFHPCPKFKAAMLSPRAPSPPPARSLDEPQGLCTCCCLSLHWLTPVIRLLDPSGHAGALSRDLPPTP